MSNKMDLRDILERLNEIEAGNIDFGKDNEKAMIVAKEDVINKDLMINLYIELRKDIEKQIC